MLELKSYGIKSDQGPHLNLNEDVVDADIVNNLFLVIDGFGGSNVGDRVANLVKEQLKRFYTKITIDPDSTLPFYFSHKYLIEGNALINAFHTTHQQILKDNDSKPLNNKGGASVVAAALSENVLTFVATGNCQAFLYRNSHLSKEILPDALSNVSRDSYHKALQSIPLSGVGLFEDLHLQVRELKLAEGDMILLLTDGVYSRLETEEIKHILEKHVDSELDAINELFHLANSRGNLDNQSAIALQF